MSEPDPHIRACVVDEGDQYQEAEFTEEQWVGLSRWMAPTLAIQNRRIIADAECEALAQRATELVEEHGDETGAMTRWASVCKAGASGGGLLVWQP